MCSQAALPRGLRAARELSTRVDERAWRGWRWLTLEVEESPDLWQRSVSAAERAGLALLRGEDLSLACLLASAPPSQAN
ncbi:MAG: hypothetical protein AB1758_32100 [Candidatus Eremiobacterota bacterium]